MTGRDVIVIGAGIAGMATAARLAVKGFNVHVFEKNDAAGGKMGLLRQDGYQFDTGPSLFTQPQVLESLFVDCGYRLEDYMAYEKLSLTTRYFYPDSTSIAAFSDHSRLADEIQEKLGISPVKTLRFLEEMKGLYAYIGRIFLDEPIHNARTWFNPRILKAFSILKWQYLFRSMHRYHEKKLGHPKLVQLFDRFATYNGSNPYTAPAMLCMIAHLEMNEGAFYPKGGMAAIPDALYRLCTDAGVTFHFNTKVDAITHADNTITGINTGNAAVPAHAVVSNSDVYFTYRHLLRDAKIADKLQQQERSSSAIIFYWGMNTSFPQLDLHNIFFSADYKAEFAHIFTGGGVYADPTIYINITSKKDSAHAPRGCENWFVLVNCAAAASTSAGDIAAAKKYVIRKLNSILSVSVEEHIATESVLTPEKIAQHTGSYLGALYGTASNTRMAAFARHGNTSAKYRGLYFAGGSVHPGGGIPLCLRSAKLAAASILSHQYS